MDTKRERLARQAIFVLGIGSLAGVLIWSKLRLVTDIPRSAYADPREQVSGEQDEAARTLADPITGRGSEAPSHWPSESERVSDDSGPDQGVLSGGDHPESADPTGKSGDAP